MHKMMNILKYIFRALVLLETYLETDKTTVLQEYRMVLQQVKKLLQNEKFGD